MIRFRPRFTFILFYFLLIFSLQAQVQVGAAQLDLYLPLLKGKQVGMVVNQTSLVEKSHIVDTLLSRGIQIKRVFAPEHGFRGKADAGEAIDHQKEQDLPYEIYSLYGKQLRPDSASMADLDILVFDIQDVGVRFYTFTSTMTYIMEACAKKNIPLLILDRPNPLGFCVDGPVLEPEHKSFVGLHPVPVIHGLTVAEYALMINGENWLKDSLHCNLILIPCTNYTHEMSLALAEKPSPNLPNLLSIYLYPSLCLFEGTSVSMGRGTNKQFQIYGHPLSILGNYEFRPEVGEGDKNPVQKGKLCRGFDLSNLEPDSLKPFLSFDLELISQFYEEASEEFKSIFFTNEKFFNKLTGNSWLLNGLKNGLTPTELRMEWEDDLITYLQMRKKYLIYP